MAKFLKNSRKEHVPLEANERKSVDEGLENLSEGLTEIGELLKMSREEKGWSLQELGKRVKMDAEHIQAIELGKQPVSEEVAKQFGKLFQRDYHDFLI